MVQVRYLCGVCEAPHPSEKEARKCEERGIEGIVIERGFTMRGPDDNNYWMTLHEDEPSGYDRNYEMLIVGDDIGLQSIDFRYHRHDYPTLQLLYSEGDIRLLKPAEFRRFSRLIHQSDKAANIREILEREGIRRLHRISAAFS